MIRYLSKFLFYPIWELNDGSCRVLALRDLARTQWLSQQELRERQWARLQNIVSYAYENTSYYNSLLRENGLPPRLESPNQFRRIPPLGKSHIRQDFDRLLSREYQKTDLVMSKTGGSTGTALTVYFDKRCQGMRNAAGMRADRWAGWDLGMKKGALWGNPPSLDTWKAKLRNSLLERLVYLDTMNLNTQTMRDFVNRWLSERPEILFGHAHSLYVLATFAKRNKITDIRPRGIISTSMTLLTRERQLIEEVFGCTVTDRYGCEEVGLIASECEQHKGLHLNADHVYVEFIKDDGTPAAPGEEGEIIVTDLINRGMPLIRYRVQDRGVPSARTCPCGRGLPLMERVTGRTADFLKKADGSLVAGISLIERTLTGIKGISQMQIVQEAMDRITVNLVKGADYDRESERQLTDEFKRSLGGSVSVQFRYVDDIPQERSGKYRFSICNV